MYILAVISIWFIFEQLQGIAASVFLSHSPVTGPKVFFRVRNLSKMPS
jgi:hypothetical protein